jgi:hypothetical protein
MAKPMTADQVVRALRRWRVPFEEVPGWRTRNRNHIGPWGPVHGLMIHHTGDDADDAVDLRILTRGRPDLPGPLSQFGCDDEGTIWLVGNGRANHAGGGDPRVLRAVIEESYGAYPPRPHEHTGSAGATDGNDDFYGVETFYSGRRPATVQALHSLILLAAAICDHHGWTAKSVIGHKEWSDWKPDPGRVDMASFRAAVARRLHDGPPGPDETADGYLLRAERRLEAAHDELVKAERSLSRAVDAGVDVRGIRTRTRDAAETAQKDAARLRARRRQ